MIKSKIIIKRYQQEFSLPHLYYIPVLTLLEPSTGFATGIRRGQSLSFSLDSREDWWQHLGCLGGKGDIHCRSLRNPTMYSQDNGKAATSQQRWGWHNVCILEEMYLPFLDHLINKLDELSVKPLPGFQAQLLIPGKEIYSICILFILPRKCTNK